MTLLAKHNFPLQTTKLIKTRSFLKTGFSIHKIYNSLTQLYHHCTCTATAITDTCGAGFCLILF